MNKKFLKAIAALALAASVGAGVGALAACGDSGESYTGEYHYTNYGHEYGIKVKVNVNGTKITSVEVLDSEYVSVSDSWVKDEDAPADEADKYTWINGLDELLAKYKDKEIADVLLIDVKKEDNGEPSTVAKGQDLGGYIISGATQGSGRLLLAVQNALKDYKVYDGEYHYNNWGHEYGIKVRVLTNGDKIANVKVLPSDYVEVSDSWVKADDAPAGTADKNTWIDGLDDLLAKYEGQSVATVKGIEVKKEENGEPTTVDNGQGDLGGLLIAGATQGSGRLLLAVQNALNSTALNK